MAGFEGTWNIKENWVKGKRITEDHPAKIAIAKIGDSLYRVTIVFTANNRDRYLVFDGAPDDRTFSYKTKLSHSEYFVRLVFDSATNPQAILEGAGESEIQRWPLHPVEQPEDMGIVQPEDMGTITGTRG